MIVCVRVLCFSVIVMCYSGTVVWLYVLMCQGTVHVRVLDWCVCPQGHIGGIQCLQFDQRRLVTGGADRSVRLWDVRSGRSVHKFYGHRVRRNRPGVASICICTSFMDIGWGETGQEMPVFVFCTSFMDTGWGETDQELPVFVSWLCFSFCQAVVDFLFEQQLVDAVIHFVSFTFSLYIFYIFMQSYISSALNMSVFLTTWLVD